MLCLDLPELGEDPRLLWGQGSVYTPVCSVSLSPQEYGRNPSSKPLPPTHCTTLQAHLQNLVPNRSRLKWQEDWWRESKVPGVCLVSSQHDARLQWGCSLGECSREGPMVGNGKWAEAESVFPFRHWEVLRPPSNKQTENSLFWICLAPSGLYI